MKREIKSYQSMTILYAAALGVESVAGLAK